MHAPSTLEARTRRPRDEAIRALLDALAPFGNVVDTRSFSGLLLVLTFETTRAGLAEVAAALRAIGVPLVSTSAAAVAAWVAEGEPTEACVVMLDVTFVDGDADLRHPVPKVPG